MNFPATYGEVMNPLEITLLPHDLRALYESDPAFRELVQLSDRTRRAEKISCWTQWTPEQRIAYEAGDMLQFSRLRGYTEPEIADFSRFMALVSEVDSRFGEGFCQDVEYVLGQLVTTDQMRTINKELCRMSEAASGRYRGKATEQN